ncbi:MAG: hypothetical protein ABI193_03635, partial [Minicystis sp.]
FLESGGEGALIGPEGTGKSTLLQALVREAAQRGLRSRLLTIDHDGLPPALPVSGEQLLCLDEADRLSWFRLRLLRLRCRRRSVALLVTGHRPLGLPTLRQTRVSADLATSLAAQVLARSPSLPALVRAEEAGEMLREQRGNLRQVLLSLYDRYEERYARSRAALSDAAHSNSLQQRDPGHLCALLVGGEP